MVDKISGREEAEEIIEKCIYKHWYLSPVSGMELLNPQNFLGDSKCLLF